jgi:hypothetical protein
MLLDVFLKLNQHLRISVEVKNVEKTDNLTIDFKKEVKFFVDRRIHLCQEGLFLFVDRKKLLLKLG